MMTAELQQITDPDLDQLLDEAVRDELAGRLDSSLAALAIVVAELCAQGRLYQYLFEWIARLYAALGEYAAAERALVVGLGIAQDKGHRPGAFRMELALARNAREAMDVAAATTRLAGLRDGSGEMLTEPTPDRREPILRWVRRLRFSEQPGVNFAVLQVEAALAIAELWAQQGKYRSALWLVDGVEALIDRAAAAVRRDQIELLRSEWELAAGLFDDCQRRLAPLLGTDPLDAVRLALVRARLALACGGLSDAISQLEVLSTAPSSAPRLFAHATVMRIAVHAELNQPVAAEALATEAIAQLGDAPDVAPLASWIQRAGQGAAVRRRSVLELWEASLVPSEVRSDWAPSLLPLEFDKASFGTVWVTMVNQILISLEARDRRHALEQQQALERVTSGVESRYVEARVRMSSAMVQYYHHGATEASVETFLSLAASLRAMGARGDAAQATRFAAWACARLRRFDDYTQLATRAAAELDELASELSPAHRVLFLLNKWNGRDELVEGRMRDLLGPTRRASRGQMVRTFREIGELTHWPIAEAFDEGNASALGKAATADAAARWLAERMATTRARPFRARGLALRSALSLWRVPSRTLVLHYHTLPDRTYLFRVARGRIDVRILPVGRVHLQLDYQREVTSAEQMTWLAANLGVTEALADFPRLRRLVIVPHHEIAEVPFAALATDAGPLCKRVELAQLDRVEYLRPRWRRARCTRFVVVGLSNYLGSGFRDLDAAEREAHEVATTFGTTATECYLADRASRPAVLAALPTASHVHFAAHGSFDATQPAESGIILRDGTANGYTTVSLAELRRLDLRKVRVVTLATCRSAKAAALPGRERICLPSALLDAGASGVIGSLWPVLDEPSVDLMTKLYRRMQTERPAAALAGLQAEAAAEGLPPETWAGLAFYGND